MTRNDVSWTFRYTLIWPDGHRAVFTIELDPHTCKVRHPETGTAPDWTRLTFHQCPNCPLYLETHPYCPAARAIAPVVESMRDRASFEEVEVIVDAPHRQYCWKVSLQHAVSSLMGLIMPTSGCPILDRLRPMVLTHLPFASPRETTYRLVSTYLLAQYFRHQQGLPADLELQHLLTFLRDVQTVNTSLCERLRAIIRRDAGINAVVVLDSLSRIAEAMIEMDALETFAPLFDAYLR